MYEPKMTLSGVAHLNGGAATARSNPWLRAENVKSNILDPIRSICEAKDLQFFVVLQSASSPTQRFWTSSKQLNNLCGNLILEFATYVDTETDGVVPEPVIGGCLDLKLDIDDSFALDNADLPVERSSPAPSVEEVSVSDDECVLLPAEDADDDNVTKTCRTRGGRNGKTDDENEEIIDENAESNDVIGVIDDESESVDARVPNEELTRDLQDMDSDFLLPFNRKRKIRKLDWLPEPSTAWKRMKLVEDLSFTDNEDTEYLDDDSGDGSNGVGEIDPSDAPTAPIIWKHHEFDRGIRPSTMKRLFVDKVVFDEKMHTHHVSDYEYSATLLKIIQKRNPYCVFYPKRMCQYFPRKSFPEYFAEYFCRYSSCNVQAHVRIRCSETFKTSIEFLEVGMMHNTGKSTASVRRVRPDCPYILFSSHDESITNQLSMEKQHFKENGIDANILREVFLSKLKEGRDKIDGERSGKHCIVSTRDYIEVLQPVLRSANPSCRFTVPMTECFVRSNKRTNDREIRTFSLRLRCAFEGCPMRVTVYVSNPNGDVTLNFTKTKLLDGPPKEQEGDGDTIDIDHGGTLSSMLDEKTSEPVLTIPSKIEHDEPLTQEVLERVFLSQLPSDPSARLIRDHLGANSNHTLISRPIVEIYNPICHLVCRMTKIIRKANEFKMVYVCREKRCDFQGTIIVQGDDGRIRLELTNRSVLEEQPQFCYIRHERVTDYKFNMRLLRGEQRQKFMEENKDFLKRSSTQDILEKFDLTMDSARNLKKDAVMGYVTNYRKKHSIVNNCETEKYAARRARKARSKTAYKALLPEEKVKVDGKIIVAFEDTSAGPLWTLPSATEHDERIPQTLLQQHFLSAIHDDPALIKDCLGPETAHKEVTKPIMEKYNPLCRLVSSGSRILKSTIEFKVWFHCKREGCDFIGTCIVKGQTGRVRCELRNKKSGPTISTPFCYIRHDQSARVRVVKTPRKPALVDRDTNDIAEEFNVSTGDAVLIKRRSVAKSLKRRAWNQTKKRSDATPQTRTDPGDEGSSQPKESRMEYPRRVLCDETLPLHWFDPDLRDESMEELQRSVMAIIRRYNPICNLLLVGKWRMPSKDEDFNCCYRCNVPYCDFQLEFAVSATTGSIQLLLTNTSRKASDTVTINHGKVDYSDKIEATVVFR